MIATIPQPSGSVLLLIHNNTKIMFCGLLAIYLCIMMFNVYKLKE
jgi:hypothetical protein